MMPKITLYTLFLINLDHEIFLLACSNRSLFQYQAQDKLANLEFDADKMQQLENLDL